MMNIYKTDSAADLLKGNAYAGRGIIIGTSANGRYAVTAYFIMGRSQNSRNRIFIKDGATVRTEPFDSSKVEDPSLIIYNAVRENGGDLVVTNGDQTDTVCDLMAEGKSFSEALATRCFEPDSPNFTPRISGILHLDGGFDYEMSILKSIDPDGSDCCRYTYAYPSKAGLGHFIHTYQEDVNPLPSFEGEPRRVAIPQASAHEWAQQLWASLNEDNKVSLYVSMIDVHTGSRDSVIINKHN